MICSYSGSRRRGLLTLRLFSFHISYTASRISTFAGSLEKSGKAGDIVEDEGQLYRSIHDVKDAGQNRKPSETPSMWTPIGNPLEEFPEWVQPIGAHDAYSKDAKTSHSGKKWVSEVDGNVWEPGVYGWAEYSEPEPQEAPQEPQEGALEEPGE